MPLTKYSKWTGADWASLSLEDLLDRLADFLLQSGFDDYYSRYSSDNDQTLDALREAIMRALIEDGLLSDEELDQLSDERGNIRADALAELLDRLIERLVQEGYIKVDAESSDQREFGPARQAGSTGRPGERSVKFELTERRRDFLGFRA